MSDNNVDLFVIGAGSGGVRAARMAAGTGAKVVVAESKYLGGTCVNVGCVPKKLFYYGAHFSNDFNDAKGYGWSANHVEFDWPTLRDNKTTEISRLNGIYEKLLNDAGVKIIDGFASIQSPTEVAINGEVFSAKKILVATGCQPFVPEFPGSEYAVTSDDMFSLDQLPSEALVVGGGYIALEFAGILNGLGVKTTLSYRGEQLLKHFDTDLGKRILSEAKSHGIDVKMGSQLNQISRNDDGRLTVSYADGSRSIYGLVLYATGRNPATTNIGLENTAVETRANGEMVVDDYFQSAEPTVYALGDIIGTPALTPVALAQGMAFVDTWFRDTKRTVDYDNIATAVFSSPNIATVGLSEAVARARYAEISVYESEFRHLKHTLGGSSERTYMKLVVDAQSDRVIGAHMLGQDAGEIIQGIAIAVKAGATKAVFDQTIGVHPTAAEEFVTMRTATVS